MIVYKLQKKPGSKMRLAKLTISLPCLVIIMALCTSAAQASAIKQSALQAGQAWLELIDHGEYGQSWTKAAAYFKSAIAKKKWVDTLKAVRKPLGKSVSRKVLIAAKELDHLQLDHTAL